MAIDTQRAMLSKNHLQVLFATTTLLLWYTLFGSMIRPVAAFRSLRPASSHVWRLSHREGIVTRSACRSLHNRIRTTSAYGIVQKGNGLEPQQYHNQQHFFSSEAVPTSLFMTSIDTAQEEATATKTMDSEWNLAGLKKETQRLLLRCHKKVGKAQERLRKGQELAEELATDPTATLEQLEQCPNVEALKVEVEQLQDRLGKLSQLEYLLEENFPRKKGKVVLPEDCAEVALELQIGDTPPKKQARGPSKAKGPRQKESSRLPYRTYFSLENIEIRVGKQAEDNDQLTLSPQHRDGSDHWMHAAGCPGSHVVIRSEGRESLPEEVVNDAAALAARQSKAKNSPVVPVSMTVCRDIIKPPGAKAGLVQLKGKVRTIKVNMKEAQERLKRLDETVVVN